MDDISDKNLITDNNLRERSEQVQRLEKMVLEQQTELAHKKELYANVDAYEQWTEQELSDLRKQLNDTKSILGK